MDKISIALMGKISELYENRYKDCWFTMNKIPHIFDIEDFDFPTIGADFSPEEVGRRIDNQCNFSILVDEIPQQNMYYQSTGKNLSDTYRNIITQLTPIENELDPEKEKALLEIQDLLSSEKYENYQTFQRKYDTLKIEVNNALSAMLNAENQQFKNEQKTVYDTKIEELNQVKSQWITDGYKFEIERAIQNKAAIYNSGFLPDWQNKLIEFELAERQGIGVPIDYFVTGYTPQINKDNSGWSKVSLNQHEIEKLFQKTCEKSHINNYQEISNQSLKIKNLKAKFANIIIHRNWFANELFDNQFWKLPDYLPPVSDGNNPSSGMIPGYLFSMIMVKDVDIELEPSNHNKQLIQNQTNSAINLGPILMAKPMLLHNKVEMKSVEKIDTKALKGIQLSVGKPFLTEKIKTNALLKAKMTQPKPKISEIKMTRLKFDSTKLIMPSLLNKLSNAKIVSATGQVLNNVNVVITNLKNNKKQILNSKNGEIKFLMRDPFMVQINHTGFEPYVESYNQPQKSYTFILKSIAKPPPEEKIEFEGIQVFGYLCKKVPLCPNPYQSKDKSEGDHPQDNQKKEFWVCYSFENFDNAIKTYNGLIKENPNFQIKQFEDNFRIIISKENAANLDWFSEKFPDAWTLPT